MEKKTEEKQSAEKLDMKHYHKHVAYSSILYGLLAGGYEAAENLARGKKIGDIILISAAYAVGIAMIVLFTFALLGENLCPPDREGSSKGLRILVAIGMIVVGFIVGAILNKL